MVMLFLLLMAATRLSLVSLAESLGTILVPARLTLDSTRRSLTRHVLKSLEPKRNLDLQAPWSCARSLAPQLATQAVLQQGAPPLSQRLTTLQPLQKSELSPRINCNKSNAKDANWRMIPDFTDEQQHDVQHICLTEVHQNPT